MGSFKDAREMLLLCFDQNINEEEFVLLYDANTSQNLAFPYYEYNRFSLDDKDGAECIADFRVEKADIPSLVDALILPPIFKCPNGTVCDGTEGLCMLLKRFAYPCRYSDMIPIFGRAVPEICLICNEVTDWIFDHHSHRITQWNQTYLSPASLQVYANAITNKGAALNNCFGFIDGTVRPICRPGKNQRVVYNGHKRVHSLKFQSTALPNGLIGHLYGPVEGRMHDSRMLAESRLYNDLQQFAFSPGGEEMCLYGDPAYPLRLHLQAPFRNAMLTREMKKFNESMSRVRVSVEWLFGDIVNYFKFMDFKKNMKIGLSQVAKMYVVCAILRNALTCLYSNTTAMFFELDPPTLFEYFS